jgi:hypothetical protein
MYEDKKMLVYANSPANSSLRRQILRSGTLEKRDYFTRQIKLLGGVYSLLILGLSGATIMGATPSAAAPPQCLPSERWNSDMQMCMPNEKAGPKAEVEGTLPDKGLKKAKRPGPSDMPSSSLPASPMDSSMSMPGGGKSKPAFMFQLNQFMVYSDTSGPRGQSRLTGPGSWMLMYDQDLTPRNHLQVRVMGSPEQWTIGDKGTPQLLQTENIDNMHAHDTIMELAFRDTVALGADGTQQLTFLFAPRGAAAIGPVPFMHRPSAEGNPDAPLGHALQDGFHDASTVLGLEYHLARTTVEATMFSGQDVSWPLPLHSLDSFAFRLNQGLNDHFSVGVSYGDVFLPNEAGGADHNKFISAWLTTTYMIGQDTLNSSFVWARARNGAGVSFNSFLAEAVYQRGMNAFFGRAEMLQITPEQLDLVTVSSLADAKWVEALTVGYERILHEKNGLSLRAGGSYTQDFIPGAFEPDYGSDPRGFKFFLRLKFAINGGHSM